MIEFKSNGTQKALFVDGHCQGVSTIDGTPLSPYMLPIMEHIDKMADDSTAIFLGGGAFLLPAYFSKHCGESFTWEISRDIVDCVQKNWPGLIDKCNRLCEDAVNFKLEGEDEGRVELIVLDCYDGSKRPQDLYCEAFIRRCVSGLLPEGTLVINYCGDSGEIESFGKMLIEVFKNIKKIEFFKDRERTIVTQAVFFCSTPIE